MFNCVALQEYLKKYGELADVPNGFIDEIIKDTTKNISYYTNERSQWKSTIHTTSFKNEFIDDLELLQISDEELASFYQSGKEKLNSSLTTNSNHNTTTQSANIGIKKPNQEPSVEKLANSFGFNKIESDPAHCGIKRKIDVPIETLQSNSKFKLNKSNTWSDSGINKCGENTRNNSLENKPVQKQQTWVPRNNNLINTIHKKLWNSTTESSSSARNSLSDQDYGLRNQVAGNQPVDGSSRKYCQALPPVKTHSDYNSTPTNRNEAPISGPFRSARDELVAQNIKKYGHAGGVATSQAQAGATKRSLGTRKGGVYGKFVPPMKLSENGELMDEGIEQTDFEPVDERLKNIDPKMIEMISNEIMYVGKPVEWDDIAGLEFAKTTIKEIVVWPLLRPDIFSGLRGPPKGILLFGPPGTGKTLIGKCIAAQSKSTFFSISASSLTSKWIGDGEKMVRALFAVARCHQPAVVFIDEIDSLLSQRSETEHESSRRLKTEFLVQLDGATTADDERILVVGATNRPQELDEAARRRLVKRLYIPLPEQDARSQMVRHLMSEQRCILTDDDIQEIARLSDGFSGADMRDLCREAAYGPIRSINLSQMEHINAEEVRPVTVQDFKTALQQVRPSVSNKDLLLYEDWNKTYGYGGGAS